MPIIRRPNGWFWGSQGPFRTRGEAVKVAQAAHAAGFEEEDSKPKKKKKKKK